MAKQKTPHQSLETAYMSKEAVRPRAEHDLYQALTIEEDIDRTNVHYEQPAEFFLTVTGGKWNCYSCNWWPEGVTTQTESQEAKLSMAAEIMELKPGMRVLDVGCGWGGPLSFFAKNYGVSGVGLTLSNLQKASADKRIANLGVDVDIQICHWKDFDDTEGFDAIYTDEVIVHFFDLPDFFKKCHSLLKEGGIMLNKEAHFTHPNHLTMSRADVFVNEIYGFTGNYRTLAEELTYLHEANFELKRLYQAPNAYYLKTFDCWMSNMYENKDRLIELVGEDYYKRFRMYLRIVHRLLKTTKVTVDMVAGRKLPIQG